MQAKDYRVNFPIHWEAYGSTGRMALLFNAREFTEDFERIEGVARALAQGKDPNQQDEKGHIALHLAIKNSNHDIAKFLVYHLKTNPHLKDDEGNSALDLMIHDMAYSFNFNCLSAHVTSESFLKCFVDIIKPLIWRGVGTEAYFVRDKDPIEKEKATKHRIKMMKEDGDEIFYKVIDEDMYPSIQSIIGSAFQDIDDAHKKYGLPSKEAARNFLLLSKEDQAAFLQTKVVLNLLKVRAIKSKAVWLSCPLLRFPAEINDIVIDNLLPSFFSAPSVSSQASAGIEEILEESHQPSP